MPMDNIVGMVGIRKLYEKRKPLQELEKDIVKIAMSDPGGITEEQLGWLRYIVSFARLGVVRNSQGQDVDVEPIVSRFRWLVGHELSAIVQRRNAGRYLLQSLPKLIAELQQVRKCMLEHSVLDQVALEAEVCQRQLVVVSGGGGGCGYGYAGAYKSFHLAGLEPKMLAGTSIGALVGIFRARSRAFDQLPMIEAARRLTWTTVFRVLDSTHKYGIPATLRMYLRASLDSMFQTPDGRSVTFADCEIPLLVVATGLTVDAFKHDMSYYEHLMDDALDADNRIFRKSKLRKILRMTSLLYEFFSNPQAMKEVVFGADELTMQADVLDAAGFSSAVPGLLHYDVLRNDPRMTSLLDQMYGEFGITRLTEGGLVNNVPVRPLVQEIMKGRITRRNPFVVALDCFSPQLNSMWYPIQQLVVPNVKENIWYADMYFSLKKRLPALNVVPTVEQSLKAMQWTSDELQPHLPFVKRMVSSHGTIPYEQVLRMG